MALLAFKGVMITFGIGGGFVANTGAGANWFVTFLAYVSPLRYASEIILRRMTVGRTVQDDILDHFGYTYGIERCFACVIGFGVFCFILGWYVMWKRNKDK